MKAKDLQAVVFDLDGTLLNSAAVHYDAYLTMFARFGIEMDEELFWEVYSPNWFAVYEAMGLAKEDWELADKIWLNEVANHDPQLFPGVKDLLAQLQMSYRLGIVTSGSKERVLRDLRKTGLMPYFPVLVTGGDISEPKPAPQGLNIALEGLQTAPHQAIYVGDTHEDRQMAQAAGVEFIGVENRILKADSQASFVTIDAVADLADYIGLSGSDGAR